MSGDLPNFRLSIEPETITIEGDPTEGLDELEGRIEELTAALRDLDEDEPQYRAVRFELNTLTSARNALKEHLETLEENED